MRNLIVILCCVVLFACDDNDSNPQNVRWDKLGLDGKIVNELALHDNQLYAATSSGLYVKTANSEDDFELLEFEDDNVKAILLLENDHIFASVVENEIGAVGKLFRSTNGGDNFDEVENDFGGEDPETINSLAVDPDNPSVLYATGIFVIAKSEDAGANWEPIYGDWGGFGSGVDIVKINPNKTNEIWAGGQGPIENGFLLRSENEEDWQEWNELVENPTVVKEIIFDKNDEENVYVGFEGALLATENGGTTWSTLIDSEENRFFFGIGKSTVLENTLFSGGWLKRFDEPQPLILFYSTDDGEHWEELEFPGEDFGGIQDIIVVSESNQERIFLALYKGGVYEVTIRREFLEEK